MSTRPIPEGTILASGDPEHDNVITLAWTYGDENEIVELAVYEWIDEDEQWVWARDMTAQVSWTELVKLIKEHRPVVFS